MGNEGKAIPRWAKDFGEETWERIHELLHEGFDAPDVIRELKLPKDKLRSLQRYAAKFGPRRRLIAFAQFKDALLKGAVDSGEGFAKALSTIVSHAVSEDVDHEKQRRAVDSMTKFTKVLAGMMASDQKQEAQRALDDKSKKKVDPDELVRRVLDIYASLDAPGSAS